MKPERRELYEAVVAERYGPPIPQAHNQDGPTARWNAHEEELALIRRLYNGGWSTDKVARHVGRPWHEVVAIIEGWT